MPDEEAPPQTLRIAVEGCCHGELDKIYGTIEHARVARGVTVDLLICCGDFQAVRNQADLSTMACPAKHRAMNTFYKYYSGEKVAPVLTIFIGGNHEASNHSWELPYGGWVAPNIYYLGFAGVVNFGGVRIGGISGIYKSGDYHRGHFEKPPFSDRDIRSFYHVREYEVFQLSQLTKPLDVFLSHDWPVGVTRHGDEAALLRKKPFFRDEVRQNALGSVPNAQLLAHLRPSYWFSGHLHCKFAAVVEHNPSSATTEQHPHRTRFLALDKCLPGRDFLQIVELPRTDPSDLRLRYDQEWLAVVRATQHLRSYQRHIQRMPVFGGPDRSDFRRDPEALAAIDRVLEERGGADVPVNFAPTVPAFVPGAPDHSTVGPHANAQTAEFCTTFGLVDPCHPPAHPPQMRPFPGGPPPHAGVPIDGQCPPSGHAPSTIPQRQPQVTCTNPDEIALSSDDEAPGTAVTARASNPDQIALDASSDEEVPSAVTAVSSNPEQIALDASSDEEV